MSDPAQREAIEYAEFLRVLGLGELGDRHASHALDGERAGDFTSAQIECADFVRVCPDGERTAHLARIAGRLIGGGCDTHLAQTVCLAWNSLNAPPLPTGKVVATVTSIARTHKRNHPLESDTDEPIFDVAAAGVGRFLDTEPPAQDWVLENCMVNGKVGLLVAPGGTGKSQLVLQIAYDIATGRHCYSPWKPGCAGKVLVLSAEDEEDELHRRIRRLAADDIANPDAGPLLKTLRENLLIVPRVGEDNLMTKERDREVEITPFVDRLIKTVASIDDLRLIIVDPVSRFRGGEENSAEDTTRFVQAVERIGKTTGCAILIVHHTNKGSSNGEQTQTASRGSSALTDGVRLQINMSIAPGSHDSGGQLVELRITKSNYASAGIPILLRRDGQGRLLAVDAEEAKQEMRKLLFGTLEDTLTSELADGQRYSKSTFKDKYGGVHNRFNMGKTALAQLIDRAVAAGELRIEPGKDKLLTVVKRS